MKNIIKRITAAMLAVALVLLGGCSNNTGKLDPKNPVTITAWHYYNGSVLNAFTALVDEFNETDGLEKGIIIEISGYGNVSELEKAVMASANKEIGSSEMPNIFASYADTAYAAEKLGLLANLGDYFTEQEQSEYIQPYIEEGRIGLNNELRIFPVIKSTEILMLNDTDWAPFAAACGLTYDDVATMEGVARVSKLYYEWTDSQTDVPDDGKSFFGRDAMANLFIIASKEFGDEIFEVQNGAATININEEVMKRIWDYYYVPFISGYYSAYGKFRSDDAKVGDILAYVGSTVSAAYFPSEVTVGGKSYPVEAKVMPAPLFEGAERVMVQQGAGMVVTKSTPQQEYASVEFLKWFTDAAVNIEFSSLSAYMPVKKNANDYDLIVSEIAKKGRTLDAITDETLRIAIDEVKTSELYTNKAFSGGAAARSVLEYNLQDKAIADRKTVVNLIAGGMSHAEAVAQFNTDANFYTWLTEFMQKLNDAIE